MKTTFIKNELVRDNIPNIIRENGCDCKITKISKEEDKEMYNLLLKRKLKIEANELSNAKNIDETKEELADCLEIVKCLLDSYDISEEEIRDCMKQKELKKGSFKEGLFMHTYEKDL